MDDKKTESANRTISSAQITKQKEFKIYVVLYFLLCGLREHVHTSCNQFYKFHAIFLTEKL